jgi:urease accessory protein
VDPCIPFSTSSFQQSVNVSIEPDASVILVDWFGAGRLSRGERWDFDHLQSQTTLSRTGAEPFLVESTLLNPINYRSRDPFGFREFNAFCSVILHGPEAVPVIHQLKHLSQQLASAYTRIRTDSTHEPQESSLSLSGRVLLGVSEVKCDSTSGLTHVARLAATCNEDIYRILHSSFRPLGFGIEFYKDRIHSTQSQIRPLINIVNEKEDMEILKSSDKHLPFQGLSWNAYMLADSGLPTGGFAHSAGIEAAAQLGLVETEKALQDYIHVSLRSVMQQQVPFVMRSLTRTENWQRLDTQLHASMVANAVACRASQEQGEGLLRVAISWLRHRNDLRTVQLLQEIQENIVGDDNGHAHLAIVFGLVTSSLALNEAEAAQLFGYCAARDMVSAAIRLNLIGPLAGVTLLDSCWGVIKEGVASAVENEKEGGPISSTCSPIAEAVYPCHDLLSTRLFRT